MATADKLISWAVAPSAAVTADLGISGANFTVNGSSKFLLGASYFDIMQGKQADFQYLAANRFNMIRAVLYTWTGGPTVPAISANGTFTGQSTIIAHARALAALGIVMQVAIHDWEASPQSTNFTGAVTNVVTALAGEKNVFFDLMDEHNTGIYDDHGFTKTMCDAAIAANANAAFTVSSRGDFPHFYTSSGNTLQPSVVTAEVNTGIKFAQPHCFRSSDWASQSGNRTAILKSHLATIGRVVPVGLFEETRRGGGSGPTQADFFQAAKGCKDAGGGGWLLHNDSCFEMSGPTTFENRLDSVNRSVIAGLATHLGL